MVVSLPEAGQKTLTPRVTPRGSQARGVRRGEGVQPEGSGPRSPPGAPIAAFLGPHVGNRVRTRCLGEQVATFTSDSLGSLKAHLAGALPRLSS